MLILCSCSQLPGLTRLGEFAGALGRDLVRTLAGNFRRLLPGWFLHEYVEDLPGCQAAKQLSPHVQWRPLVNFPYLFAASALVSSFLKGFLLLFSFFEFSLCFSLSLSLFSPFINHTDRFPSTHYTPSFFRIWRMWNLLRWEMRRSFPFPNSLSLSLSLAMWCNWNLCEW